MTMIALQLHSAHGGRGEAPAARPGRPVRLSEARPGRDQGGGAAPRAPRHRCFQAGRTRSTRRSRSAATGWTRRGARIARSGWRRADSLVCAAGARYLVSRGCMRTFKLIVEYDGTDFRGWQIQPGQRTVQGELCRAVQHATCERSMVTGAGRTDSGVHAVGQVASFSSGTRLSPAVLRRALNGWLPWDIRVRSVEEAPGGFNARFDAKSRTYHYIFIRRETALWRNYYYLVTADLDLRAMRSALGDLRRREGFHDVHHGGRRLPHEAMQRDEGGARRDAAAPHPFPHRGSFPPPHGPLDRGHRARDREGEAVEHGRDRRRPRFLPRRADAPAARPLPDIRPLLSRRANLIIKYNGLPLLTPHAGRARVKTVVREGRMYV